MSQKKPASRPLHACLWGLIASSVGLSMAAPAAALTIVPTFDSSFTGLSNAAAVEAAFNAVARNYDSAFANPVNINIKVSWGAVAGQALPASAIGASSDNLYGYFTYAQIK